MNNDVQIVDVIESFKEQIANMAYQIAFKDATIKALEKQVEEMTAHLEKVTKPVEPVKTVENSW